jgi:hypothetical protein
MQIGHFSVSKLFCLVVVAWAENETQKEKNQSSSWCPIGKSNQEIQSWWWCAHQTESREEIKKDEKKKKIPLLFSFGHAVGTSTKSSNCVCFIIQTSRNTRRIIRKRHHVTSLTTEIPVRSGWSGGIKKIKKHFFLFFFVDAGAIWTSKKKQKNAAHIELY